MANKQVTLFFRNRSWLKLDTRDSPTTREKPTARERPITRHAPSDLAVYFLELDARVSPGGSYIISMKLIA